jgi:hypothetical protein
MGNPVPARECGNRNGEQELILKNPEKKYYRLNNACRQKLDLKKNVFDLLHTISSYW